MSTEPDDLDMRAAEYVLGLLSRPETAALRRDMERNAALAAAVAQWETRLTPLTRTLEPQTPPAVIWQRLEAELDVRESARTSTAPFRPRPLLRRIGFWRGATAVATALAAGLAFLLLHAPAPLPHYAAAIVPTQSSAQPWLVETRGDGTLEVTALGAADRPAGKDLELWALAAGAAKPVSLGVLPASGAMIVAAPNLPRESLQLLISLEPAGGSPTGQPTGPVLYAGALIKLE